jgi:membrane protease YdiL (CAAX protease family)
MGNSSETKPDVFAEADSLSAKDRLRPIFVGKSGIRAGWSALLFVALYLILSTVITTALSRFVELEPRGPLPPAVVFLQESSDVLVILLATWIMARLENRPFLSFGYRGDHVLTRLFSGMVWGVLSLSALVATFWKAHLIQFNGLSLTGFETWKYALAWACVALLVGFFEESLLRGYLQYTLARGLGFWWAALLLSVAFALWHASNGAESLLGLLVVGLGGLAFCLSLWYTKSLWWAIGFHAGWDWGQSYLYGTPDSGLLTNGHLLVSHASGNPLWSGGSTGPEGSLLIVPMLIAMATGMWICWGSGNRA